MNNLFIQDPAAGRIRFTRIGIEKYGADFARAGFDIHQIHTMNQFEAAVDASFRFKMESLSRQIHGEDPTLDKVLSGLPGWESH